MNRSLFTNTDKPATREGIPLAERMRPRSLEEVVGQSNLVAPGQALREMIRSDRISSVILWGPPGTGKTTIARLIATQTRSHFVAYSAVLSGIKEIKAVMSDAQARFRATGTRTILFVDEIHRFNRAQQDAFLPHVESGVIILIGATTENPSFEVIGALLSRAKVYVLKPLPVEDIVMLLKRALFDVERGLGSEALETSEDVLGKIAAYANGDARIALNALEISTTLAKGRGAKGTTRVDIETVETALQKKMLLYDKAGEEHYNLISALHKSMRNSDPDASLYWLGRMLEAGEDPVYIARRIVRFASEDVGLADVRALSVALDAAEAVQLVGLPECKLALAQAAVYLSVAPKSNALYTAYSDVVNDVERTVNEPPPMQIRNAPTRLMEELGYGQGYQYAHDLKEKIADMECLPDSLRGRRYYKPTDQGMEKKIREYLENIQERKSRSR